MVIDTHLHVYRSKAEGRGAKGLYEIWEYGSGGQPRFAEWDGDLSDAEQAMDRARVDHAIVRTLLDAPVHEDPARELVAFNEWVVALVGRDGRFSACLAVDPRFFPVADVVDHINDLGKRPRVVGIKIHPPMQELDLSDERLWPIFAACDRLGLRVVSHSGPSRHEPHLGEPTAFRSLLDAFPKLRLVLAHMGGAAWRQTRDLAAEYPQVYFDLSEIIHWLGAGRAPSAEDLVGLVRAVGTDRVMLGSDFPWYDIGHSAEIVRRLPGLTDEEVTQITGANAAGFFGVAD